MTKPQLTVICLISLIKAGYENYLPTTMCAEGNCLSTKRPYNLLDRLRILDIHGAKTYENQTPLARLPQ